MNDVTKRFIETYKAMGLTGYQMNKANKTITKQKVSNIETGKYELSIEMLLAFADTYPNVNKMYILTGEGNMFIDESDTKVIKPYISENLTNVPYVPVSATASFVESIYGASLTMDTYSVMPEDGEILADNYVVFQVDGDSMEPTIPNRAKILARKIEEGQWENADGVVVVVYGKILTVKRIKKNSLYLDNKIILSADNTTHGEMEVGRREIRGMWKAERIISQKIL